MDRNRLIPAVNTVLVHQKIRDIFFLVLFGALWASLFFVTYNAIDRSGGITGYRRLLNGVQYDGKICGMPEPKGAGEDNEYLYWPEPEVDNKMTICIVECPEKTGQQICHDINGDNVCWDSIPTFSVHHYCVPKDEVSKGKVARIIQKNDLARMVVDIGVSWPVILLAIPISLVCSLIFVKFLKYFSGILVIIMLSLTALAIGVGGVMMLVNSFNIDSTEKHSVSTTRWTAIGILVVDILFVALLIAIRKSIKVGVGCIKLASRAVGEMKTLLAVPFIKFFFMLVVFGWFATTAVFLVSAGKFKDPTPYKIPGSQVVIQVKHVEWDENLRDILIFVCFGGVSGLAFVMAIGDLIVSGSIGRWYFTKELPDGSRFVEKPIRRSTWVTFRYLLGTAACGSLLLTLTFAVRTLLEFLEKRLKKHAPTNHAVNAILKMLKCCFFVLRKFLQFLTRQGYIIAAIEGTGFLSSCKRAFLLLSANVLRLSALNMTGSVFRSLGKVCVASFCGVIGYIACDRFYGEELNNPMVPAIMSAVVGFFISAITMQILELAMDTTLLCYLIDEAIHGGVPRFGPNFSDTLGTAPSGKQNVIDYNPPSMLSKGMMNSHNSSINPSTNH
eukprot:TRINITY_DN398_c4_g1_i1.p1 TRINITY_DN398_c4_g1~~TRINITY_DN398_c4_g1_i1.p1  ORF type:complete len:614 (-),score=136.44 TRINITY_DN398_c4_g1_i1:913-2754(-)